MRHSTFDCNINIQILLKLMSVFFNFRFQHSPFVFNIQHSVNVFFFFKIQHPFSTYNFISDSDILGILLFACYVESFVESMVTLFCFGFRNIGSLTYMVKVLSKIAADGNDIQCFVHVGYLRNS